MSAGPRVWTCEIDGSSSFSVLISTRLTGGVMYYVNATASEKGVIVRTVRLLSTLRPGKTWLRETVVNLCDYQQLHPTGKLAHSLLPIATSYFVDCNSSLREIYDTETSNARLPSTQCSAQLEDLPQARGN